MLESRLYIGPIAPDIVKCVHLSEINISLMKKLAIGFTLFFGVMLLISSCKSTEKCPAYGESKRYQKEIAY
jgi:hypothetical protein